MSQRQNASATGGTNSCSARPMTMLPAQNRFVRTSSRTAECQAREIVARMARERCGHTVAVLSDVIIGRDRLIERCPPYTQRLEKRG
jgi:hypothetical protein